MNKNCPKKLTSEQHAELTKAINMLTRTQVTGGSIKIKADEIYVVWNMLKRLENDINNYYYETEEYEKK